MIVDLSCEAIKVRRKWNKDFLSTERKTVNSIFSDML